MIARHAILPEGTHQAQWPTPSTRSLKQWTPKEVRKPCLRLHRLCLVCQIRQQPAPVWPIKQFTDATLLFTLRRDESFSTLKLNNLRLSHRTEADAGRPAESWVPNAVPL
jgi:hypothetical protein